MKCIVYNLEDPNQKEFYIGVNGANVQGQCGVEIDLGKAFIEVLENAIVETPVIDSITKKIVLNKNNRAMIERVPRFKVVFSEAEVAEKAFIPTVFIKDKKSKKK